MTMLKRLFLFLFAGIFLFFAAYFSYKTWQTAELRFQSELTGISDLAVGLINSSGTSDSLVASTIDQLRFRRLGHTFVVAQDGTMILHPIKELVGQSFKAEFGAELPASPGQMQADSSRGERILVLSELSGSENPGAYFVADLNAIERYDTIRYFVLACAAFLGLGLLSGLVLASIFRRSN